MVFVADGLAAKSIRAIFHGYRPFKIVETGTFLGLGSTRIIAEAIRDYSINAQFYSIECNPSFFNGATNNLKSLGLSIFVELINGLSVPHSRLLPREEIVEWLSKQPADLFDDLQRERKAVNYVEETSFNVPDDQLRVVLEKFNFRPDFVLLDSAGYLGNVEFNYLLSLLKGPTFIVLDDAMHHVKHFENWQFMLNNPKQFKQMFTVDERYGVVGFHYNPD